jgi:formylmethanofuran dehydrogenase subunit A
MTERLRLVGGRVHDPAHPGSGEVRDVCIEDGRIVAELPADAPRLDVCGLVLMAGAVDVHSHLAGPAVNLARRLEPERRAAGTAVVPTTLETGALYAGLGYTTAFDAAVSLVGARHAHLELDDTPVIDKGVYLVLGNDELLLRALEAREPEAARHAAAWALKAARAYAIKVVAPGGDVAWRYGRSTPGLDDPVAGRSLTPRGILTALAHIADELKLPHPMHLHCNDLGLAGNARTTLATMEALEGRRAHLAHLQFHTYGGEAGGRPTSRAPELAEALGRHPQLSADVGQVMFGPATTMTADSRVGAMLHELSGRKWVDADVELMAGCGVVPWEYREKNVVHAVQWIAGLELLLLSPDPWRLVLSTDHPNGGTFLTYPTLVRLLMDRAFRDAQVARLPEVARNGTALGQGLAREYTLDEIAIVTRAGPARLLGLGHKGHLGPGADADVAVYTPGDDAAAMFALPRYVLKAGRIVAERGVVRTGVSGRVHAVAPEHDPAVETGLRGVLDEAGLDLDALRLSPSETGEGAV